MRRKVYIIRKYRKLQTAFASEKVKREGINELIEFIEKTDFYKGGTHVR